ncbi:MAG TPA: flagellin [Lacipirellulaceae bacterium]|nr:flagellin [Lacipirellulaceae bacterium]
MTRINTNVSSLVAQNTLNKSNAALEQSLTRLSTGLRINTGKDDPAGLIASENLRSDITSITKAISNTDRANQVIATADSGLGQVSTLLNDIRGLVTEAANGGALSADQIAADQLQIDQSLNALNRIAQTVTFQGRKLLDGSLDFVTSAGSNFGQLSGLQINQANLGSAGSQSVDINVTTAATNAEVDITNVPAATTATNATASLTLSNVAAQAAFHFDFDTTAAVGVDVTALSGGAAAGANGNGISIVVNDTNDTTGTVSSVTFAAGTLTIDADLTGGVTNTDIATAIQNSNGGADFTATATGVANTALAAGDAGNYTPTYTTNGRDVGSTTFSVTADTAGAAANGVTVTISEDNTIANNSAVASLDGSGNIVVKERGTVTKAAIIAAIDGLTGYSAVATSSSGDSNYIDASDTPPGVATLGGGSAASGGLSQDVVFELSGSNGSQVYSFGTGTAISKLADAINSDKSATGVEATVNGTTLELTSTGYGTASFVDLKLISEASGGTIGTAVGQGTRATGTDVAATINGIAATGRANSLSVNTSSLDLNTSVAAGFTGTIHFDITGGGALFQLGPDVVTTQQARIGITSVNTASLGGTDGALYQLASGGAADLSTDPTTAARIVDEAISQITSLRGRLGAFQSTTLDSNKSTLNDTLVNLTDAESQIRDADFAAETANLTRAQILVQSGTTVLQVANQNPQNVLALLRQ